MERVVGELRDRVVIGVDIPAGQHRALIGRGGQHLNDFQAKFDVMVQFPGSRSYAQAGEPENAADLSEVDQANIVKVSGSRAACTNAAENLKVCSLLLSSACTGISDYLILQSQVKPPIPEGVTASITVPLKYHHAVTQQGNIFRTLRSYGVQVEHSKLPQKAAVPVQPSAPAAVSSARIDDAAGDDSELGEVKWQVVANYEDAEEGDSEWTLKGRDQNGLDRARKTIEDAIASSKKMTHVGFLTMPDRTLFPRIVGSKGANVSRLRAETGADITVSRENSTIVIAGKCCVMVVCYELTCACYRV